MNDINTYLIVFLAEIPDECSEIILRLDGFCKHRHCQLENDCLTVAHHLCYVGVDCIVEPKETSGSLKLTILTMSMSLTRIED